MIRRGAGWHFCGHICALAALLGLAAPAQAERADRDRDTVVTADRSTLDDLNQSEVLSGHVLLVKGTLRLSGERMEHRQDERGYHRYTVAALPGERATFHERRDAVRAGVESTIDGEAEHIEYDERNERVVLLGHAQVRRLDDGIVRDELSGERVVYDARLATYEVDGHGAQGATDRRVTIRIAPRPASAAAPAVLAPEHRLAEPAH
jgi:lipopolysaccharide export system protein LptA